LEYNRLINELRCRRKYLDTLYKTEFELVGPDPNIDLKMKDELLDLHSDLCNNEVRMMRSQEQRERMRRIIEICEINQIQNEEWIRGLNFYLTNLRKVIKSEKSDIKDTEKDLGDYEILSHQFVKNYNKGVRNHQSYLGGILDTLENQKDIDYRIQGTNE
jgi:membrane-anchored protein YejM (alkaline phosphatase superfamily)